MAQCGSTKLITKANVACERYVEKNPVDKGIQALLVRVKTRFKC